MENLKRRLLLNYGNQANYEDCLSFIATQTGTFKFTGNTISYSTNEGRSWTELPSGTNTPTIAAGNRIMWKAELTPLSGIGIGTFSSTANFEVEGKPISLLYGDSFNELQNILPYEYYVFLYLFNGCTKLTNINNIILPSNVYANCYEGMFKGCTSLTSLPSNLLPATTNIAYCRSMFEGCTSLTSIPTGFLRAKDISQHCYMYMFKDCTSLTSLPSNLLPATSMNTYNTDCYRGMFQGCTSLTSIPSGFLPATTLTWYCYAYMFQGCTSLTSLPSDLLPATTLADYCYRGMFQGCTSLTSIPSGFLPATTLKPYCYDYMFGDCSSLTTPRTNLLPATTLAQGCYRGMFKNCKKLTTVPYLPAPILVENCYLEMFYSIGTSTVNKIKCLATDISALACTNNWVNGVASSGTFIKASSMSGWSTGPNGIPRNWTVQNA